MNRTERGTGVEEVQSLHRSWGEPPAIRPRQSAAESVCEGDGRSAPWCDEMALLESPADFSEDQRVLGGRLAAIVEWTRARASAALSSSARSTRFIERWLSMRTPRNSSGA